MARIAGKLWREAGGDGDPPAMVVATVVPTSAPALPPLCSKTSANRGARLPDLAYAAIADVLDRECGERSTRVPLA